jgi:copper homeostasis protein
MSANRLLIEGCVDSVESALATQLGGGGRLELCANLDVGGTTPSVSLIQQVKSRVRIPVAVMIRPRGGSFVYSAAEIEQMIREIALVRAVGADAVVIGPLDEHDRVDIAQTRALVTAAAGTPVVFHRAFDRVLNRNAALDSLIALGVSRVLTSGGAENALEGSVSLAELVDQAAGRITIMAGGKVRGRNVRQIVRMSGVTEVHARCENDARQIRAIVDAVSYES